MAQVRVEVLPWISRAFRPGQSGSYAITVEIEAGQTLRDLLHQLCHHDRTFEERVFDPAAQRLREPVSVVINGQLLELLGGLDQPLEDGDTVAFLPAFAGGHGPTTAL